MIEKQKDPIENKVVEPIFQEDITQIDDIVGMFTTVDAVPISTPTSLKNQVKIYKSGATRRLYWYDSVEQEWVYTAGTV